MAVREFVVSILPEADAQDEHDSYKAVDEDGKVWAHGASIEELRTVLYQHGFNFLTLTHGVRYVH